MPLFTVSSTSFTAFNSFNDTISKDRVQWAFLSVSDVVCRRNTEEVISKKVTVTLPQVLVHPRVGVGVKGKSVHREAGR